MKRVLLLAVAVIALVVTGYVVWSRSAVSPLSLARVLIDVEPAAVASNVDREAVRGLVEDALDHARGVRVAEPSGDTLRVRVESFSQTPPSSSPDGQATTAGSTLSLSVELIGARGRTTARGHSVASAQGVMSPDALVTQAFKDALRQIQQARAADALDSEVLLAWLADPKTSESQQIRAMQALASRGERQATPALIAALERGPAEVSAVALQALTTMADPDAVDAIIAYSDRSPNLVRKQCIDAVRASGSVKGAPWLFTLSTGHPDEDVRDYARGALDAILPADQRVAAAGLVDPDAAATNGPL